MEADRYGFALATSSSDAAAAYRTGVDLLLSAYPGAEECFQQAISHDPGFALAHAGLARYLQIYGRITEAREAITQARKLAAGASAREKAHVGVLGFAIDGQAARALEALLAHLDDLEDFYLAEDRMKDFRAEDAIPLAALKAELGIDD